MSVLFSEVRTTDCTYSRCRRGSSQERDPASFLTPLQGKCQAGQWPGGCPRSNRGSSKDKSGRCQKAMTPAAGVRGGTGKAGSNARADSPGAREASPRRCLLWVRTPDLGQSGANEEASRPRRGWSPFRFGLPALLDLRGLAIVRDDLRPQGPALPQPICLAHLANEWLAPPPPPELSSTGSRTAPRTHTPARGNDVRLAAEMHGGPAPFGRLAPRRVTTPPALANGRWRTVKVLLHPKPGCWGRSRGLPHVCVLALMSAVTRVKREDATDSSPTVWKMTRPSPWSAIIPTWKSLFSETISAKVQNVSFWLRSDVDY